MPEPLEFIGYRGTTDGLCFRVRDTTRNAGVWLKLHERSPELNLAVKAHDPVAETLTVDFGGRTIVLPQRQARIAAAAAPPATRIAITPATVPAARAATPAVSPSIDELAAALAKRREARQQAASATPAAPAPAPAKR